MSRLRKRCEMTEVSKDMILEDLILQIPSNAELSFMLHAQFESLKLNRLIKDETEFWTIHVRFNIMKSIFVMPSFVDKKNQCDMAIAHEKSLAHDKEIRKSLLLDSHIRFFQDCYMLSMNSRCANRRVLSSHDKCLEIYQGILS